MIEAALAAARAAGFPADDPEILHEGANLVVRLRPAPVVARVTVSLARGVAALETELAFARAAVARGAPVVAPADDRAHGNVTFWQFVEHRRTEDDDARAVGRSLRALHEAIAGIDVRLDRFDRLDEAGRVAAELDHPDAGLMREAIAAARERLAGLSFDEQPLHGDAHARNALIADGGPVWTDLENISRGPIEYDLASLLLRTRAHGWAAGEDAVSAYGPHDEELVEELLPVVAAFLVPWNATLAPRDDPFLRQRIDYLRSVV